VKAINTRPFVTVFPDGVLDAGETSALGKRHWEDGRVPSPGFGTDAEQRDDVAFIDHVIETLVADSELDIDASAIYVTGASNGGMMTLRLVCHFGDPRHPSLSRVAAFLASIGEMPEGLLEGQHGREACPSQLKGEVGFRIVLGTGIDTPDCTTYPCNSPVVTGDGLMPFGQAGGRYNVYSPDQGRVISGPDTIAFWQSAFVAGMGNAGTTGDEKVGFFTQRSILSFAPSVAVLDTWVTDGGGHMLNATRMDFMPVGSSWAFLSSFRRENAGLTRVEPDWVTGY
jgi:poly(3-hydroxybutyrate) depolymerase